MGLVDFRSNEDGTSPPCPSCGWLYASPDWCTGCGWKREGREGLNVSKCPNHPHDAGPFRYCDVPLGGYDGEPARWKPRYHVQKAPGVGGHPIPTDEPVLVVRAQDVLAEEMMQFYIGCYYDLEGKDPAVESELREHLAELRRWRAENADRIKIADRGRR